jgi:hypothetical protein
MAEIGDVKLLVDGVKTSSACVRFDLTDSIDWTHVRVVVSARVKDAAAKFAAEQQRLNRVVEEHRLKEHAYLLELGKSRGAATNCKPGVPGQHMTAHFELMEREALR